MILECFGALLAALLVSLAGHLLVLGARNRRKYQFFQRNAPGLKVIENPSLFGGHSNRIANVKHNLLVIESLLKKYGPTVGYYFDSRPAVLTVDLDFIKTFIVDEQNHINRIKANLPIEELVEDCLMCAENEQWLKLRKAIAPAFAAHKIKSPNVRSSIDGVVNKLVGLIERRLDAAETERQEDFIEADAEDICHRYALALVFSNFYKQDNVVDFHADKDKYVEMIDRTSRNLDGVFLKVCAAFPSIKPFVNWLALNFSDQGLMRNTIMDYIKQQTRLNFEAAEQFDGRKTDKGNDGQDDEAFEGLILKDGSKFRRNMVDYITDQYREGKLTRREYFHSTFFLFFAADKTTTDALARLLYNLAGHQEIQERLRASVLESGVDSEYLSWVIHETLRLHPPASGGCSRRIERDIQTKHGLVPAGTFVVTPAYSIGRLREYWGPDADDFRPERWADAKNFHPVQYLAFGGGRRACPGKELALMEIKMLLNTLVRRYSFERSALFPVDNSELVNSPVFFTLVFDTPTYVRISRLAQPNPNEGVRGGNR